MTDHIETSPNTTKDHIDTTTSAPKRNHKRLLDSDEQAQVNLRHTVVRPMRSFINQARRMKLDIATIAPVHGPAVPWSAFEKAIGR